MRQHTRRFAARFLFCALVLFGCLVSHGDEIIATLRTVFESHLAEIESTRNRELDAQFDVYASGIEQLVKAFQQAGELENWQAATGEATRFEQTRVLPETPPDGTPARMRMHQERCRALFDQTHQRSSAKAKDLAAKYQARLGVLQVEATRSGNLERALAFQTETQRVQALPVIADQPAKPTDDGAEAATNAA